eukprot:GFUD01043167.1.p1 GENE.GFUD01043167.1~~GFUD01043167.1.p1  ORF type:complete len:537 (+),score=171.68 GFUD01043167.1:268-1878(+)
MLVTGRLSARTLLRVRLIPPSLTMTKTAKLSYDEAVVALNSLQTNAVLLEKVRKERQKNVHLNLPQTTKYLERSGMTLDDLDKLKVIHVSGTKGKGSTCAFCESILRHSGLKTGFYSSPHLVSVTERIRINGEPIDQDKFTSYFWSVYDKVCKGREDDDRPPYFKFLTILAFNIFWREGVDVAVVEVGIGGAYDCTNIIRTPVVSGITALGLDHTSLLGHSIKDIAWHKAGIMKPGVTTYVDPHQKEAALQVIKQRSEELGSHAVFAPPLTSHHWPDLSPPSPGLYGTVQTHNASLAVSLATHFLSVHGSVPQVPPVLHHEGHLLPVLAPARLTQATSKGLQLTRWPGRSQVIRREGVEYYLDGAHTEESMMACVEWFSKASMVDKMIKVYRVLVFNTTGDRDVRTLLEPLAELELDLVIFCTNISRHTDSVDQQNFTTNDQMQLDRCQTHLTAWTRLQTDITVKHHQHLAVPGLVIPCINDALLWGSGGRDIVLPPSYYNTPPHSAPSALQQSDLVQLLVTGSLHLVGGVIGCVR